MGASRQRHAARVVAAGLAAVAALSLGAVARADDPAALRSLRAENSSLAAKSHQVLLELYALESRLATAEQRVAALERRAAELREREASARRQLGIARAAHAEAQRRREARLRALYIAGEPDPLAVLLGADSLEAVISTFEGFDRTARQDRQIVTQLLRARRALKGAVATVVARRTELRHHLADAEAARAALAAARAERAGYLAALTRQRELTRDQIASLSEQAAESEAAAEQFVQTVGSGGAAPSSAPPPPPSAPAQAAGSMTVLSTGYCLRGTTATGIPVGWGVVAVDPSVIPLGTRMTIPGYGEGVAADTGSAVVGAMIDLWFPSCSQALTWGRRTVTITLH